MFYLVSKLFHIGSVILFLGNITTGLFWKMHADGTRDPRLIEAVMRGISRSDRWFTVPGVVAITAFGFLTAILGRLPVLHTGWILWAIVLFSLSGVVFATQVAGLQTAMLRLARAGIERGEMDWVAYRDLSRRWEFWGAVALLLPVGALVLMVLKPDLPSL